ncbi:putative transcriptional regulator [Thaumarchaeota archaeon SCGC AB-539-E09]|nr:putative transcriptional regulator [Thaumarchaeota archaeon SCGC AB-539-E09]
MKRDKYDIMAIILSAAIRGIKKTALVYRSNLNFKLMHKYTKILVEIGYLTFKKQHFFTTEKGKMYLEHYNVLINHVYASEQQNVESEITDF